MGSQHSKTNQAPSKKTGRPKAQQSGNPSSMGPQAAEAVAVPATQVKEITQVDAIEVTDDQTKEPVVETKMEVKAEKDLPLPVPSKLKRFRVNVPQSMVPGDIMSIKLGGALTKILITTPTTPSGSEGTKAKSKCNNKRKQSSQATASTSTTTSTLSSNSSPPSERPPVEHKLSTTDTVMASTEAKVPDGKMIVHAKSVIVIHAEFEGNNKQQKESMVDQAMKEIIQETVANGCNALLGMTVSIRPLKNKAGYLVKACGTPCLLLPAQVLLERSPSKVSNSGCGAGSLRTTATEVPLVRRQ